MDEPAQQPGLVGGQEEAKGAMKAILELLGRWFHAWSHERAQCRITNHDQHTKLMAGLTELTAAITDNTAAVTTLATAIDNAVAKGIGGTAPDLQAAVDAVTANTTALNAAKDKLVAATPA